MRGKGDEDRGRQQSRLYWQKARNCLPQQSKNQVMQVCPDLSYLKGRNDPAILDCRRMAWLKRVTAVAIRGALRVLAWHASPLLSQMESLQPMSFC